MYVKVRVIPGAKKEWVKEESAAHFLISVKEPASRNLANGRVRELIASHFHSPLGKVRIISGHRSPSKVFSIDNESPR